MAPESGRKRRVTNDRVLTVFQESTQAFLTTSEILEDLGGMISRPTLLRRLNELDENGELEMRETSGPNIYWLPGRVADDPERVVSPDNLVLDLDERLRDDLEARANDEEQTPERVAKDLLAEGLEEPQPLWEATKNVAFAFSLIFTVAVFVQAGSFPPIVNQATLAVAVLAMGVFMVMLMVAILNPVVEPAVASAQEWWGSRSD